MEYRLEPVSQRHAAHCRHYQLIVVYGEIRFLEVGSHLELRRRDFVVSSRDWYTKLVELELDL